MVDPIKPQNAIEPVDPFTRARKELGLTDSEGVPKDPFVRARAELEFNNQKRVIDLRNNRVQQMQVEADTASKEAEQYDFWNHPLNYSWMVAKQAVKEAPGVTKAFFTPSGWKAMALGVVKGGLVDPINDIQRVITGQRTESEIWESWEEDIKEAGSDQVDALYDVSHFLGAYAPFALAEKAVMKAAPAILEVAGGAKFMTLANQITKLAKGNLTREERLAIPWLAKGSKKGLEVVSFLGTGQVLIDPEEDGGRAERAVLDLAMWGAFELAFGPATYLLSKPTQAVLGRWRSGMDVTMKEADDAAVELKSVAQQELKKLTQKEPEYIAPKKNETVQEAAETAALKQEIKKEQERVVYEERAEIQAEAPVTPVKYSIKDEEVFEDLAHRGRLKLKEYGDEVAMERGSRDALGAELDDMFSELQGSRSGGAWEASFDQLGDDLLKDMDDATGMLEGISVKGQSLVDSARVAKLEAKREPLHRQFLNFGEKEVGGLRSKRPFQKTENEEAFKRRFMENGEDINRVLERDLRERNFTDKRPNYSKEDKEFLSKLNRKVEEGASFEEFVSAMTDGPYSAKAKQDADDLARSFNIPNSREMYDTISSRRVLPEATAPQVPAHAPIAVSSEGEHLIATPIEEIVQAGKLIDRKGGIAIAPLETLFNRLRRLGKPVPENINIIVSQDLITPSKFQNLINYFRQKFFSTPSALMSKDPGFERVVRMGIKLAREQNDMTNAMNARIAKMWSGYTAEERKLLVHELIQRPGGLTDAEMAKLPPKWQKTIRAHREIGTDVVKLVRDKLPHVETDKWTIGPDEWFPHAFVGEWKVIDRKSKAGVMLPKIGDQQAKGAIYGTKSEALDFAYEYTKYNPNAEIDVVANSFNAPVNPRVMTSPQYQRIIKQFEDTVRSPADRKALEERLQEVARVKPKGKFVGSFMPRIVDMPGYIDDPIEAMGIYLRQVIAKVHGDQLRQLAAEITPSLPPGIQAYVQRYVDEVTGISGRDAIEKAANFSISGVAHKIISAKSFIKLAFRPRSVLVNRLQPLQTSFAEIGNYLGRGMKMKHTKAGRELLRESGINEMAFMFESGSYVGREMGVFTGSVKETLSNIVTHPIKTVREIGLKGQEWSERNNRADSYLGAYLFATKKLGFNKREAMEWATDHVIDTQYLYHPANQPEWFRTPVGKVLLQFKPFAINYLNNMARYMTGKPLALAGRPLTKSEKYARAARFATVNIMAGGMRAIPYAARLGMFWWIAVNRPDIIKLLQVPQRILAGEFGDTASRLSRGVAGLAGVDISSSAAVEPEYLFPASTWELIGLSASDVKHIGDFWFNGKDPRELVKIMPAAFDAMQAYDVFNDANHFYRSQDGRVLGKLDVSEIFLMAGGFRPLEASEEFSAASLLAQQTMIWNKREESIVSSIVNARVNGDIEAEKKAWEKATKMGHMITEDQIIRKLMGQYETPVQSQSVPVELKMEQMDLYNAPE